MDVKESPITTLLAWSIVGLFLLMLGGAVGGFYYVGLYFVEEAQEALRSLAANSSLGLVEKNRLSWKVVEGTTLLTAISLGISAYLLFFFSSFFRKNQPIAGKLKK